MAYVMNDCGIALDPAVGSGRSPEAIESLVPVGSTAQVLVNEAAMLSALWTELVSGLCKIEEATFSERSCGVVVSRTHRSSGAPARISPRDIEILERALVEGVRKSVAVDFGLCASSVAEILRRCFVFMGLSCWPSRIPLLLVVAAHANAASGAPRPARLILAQNQHFPRQTISVPRPDDELAARLSPAEYAVVRLLVEGKSYAEMAEVRRTSKRTVANQLASAFHRLRISGRAELLCLLAQRKVLEWRSAGGPVRVGMTSPVVDTPSYFARAAGDLLR